MGYRDGKFAGTRHRHDLPRIPCASKAEQMGRNRIWGAPEEVAPGHIREHLRL